jgi:hypothetical protein
MTTEQNVKVVEFLKDSNLLDNIVKAIHETGIVGEELPIKTVVLICCGKLVRNKKTYSTNIHVEDESGTGKDYLVEHAKQIAFNRDWIEYNSPSPTAISYGQRKTKLTIQRQNGQGEPIVEYETVDKLITENSVIYIKDGSNELINGDDCKLLLEAESVNLRKTVKGGQISLQWKKPVVIITTADTSTDNQILRRLPSLHLNGSIEQTKAIVDYQIENDCDIISKKEKCNEELIKIAQSSFYELKKIDVDLKNVKHLIKEKLPKNEEVIMRSFIPRLLDYIKFSTALHQYQREKIRDDTYLANNEDVEIGFEIFNNLYKTEFADISVLNVRQIKIREKLRANPYTMFTAEEIRTWREAGGTSYSQIIQKDLPLIIQADPTILIDAEHQPHKYGFNPRLGKIDIDKLGKEVNENKPNKLELDK